MSARIAARKATNAGEARRTRIESELPERLAALHIEVVDESQLHADL